MTNLKIPSGWIAKRTRYYMDVADPHDKKRKLYSENEAAHLAERDFLDALFVEGKLKMPDLPPNK